MSLSQPKDPIAAATHANPYPYYASLVAYQPLAYDAALKLWVASSAEAVTSVLSSPLCHVRPMTEQTPRALVGTPSGDVFQHLIRMNEGEKHIPLKQAVTHTLHSEMAQHTGNISRRWAMALFEALNLAHTPDKIMDLAFQLPVYVITSLLGISDDDLPQTAAWVGDFVRGIAPLASAEQIAQGATAAQHLRDVFATQPPDALFALFGHEAAQAGQYHPDALMANTIGLMMQSYDGTAGLIGNALIALAEHPSIAQHVIEHPTLLRPFLREVLRYDSPVQNTRRFVVQDGIIGGHEMKAGDAILVLLAAANRDPATNRDPEQFDIFRKNARLFTFGIGAHACPGEHMAVTIAQAALDLLLTTSMPLEFARENITYRPSVNARIPVFAPQTILIR